mgnify:CR=1 FL=1
MSKKKKNPNQEPDLFADMGDESDTDANAVATAPRVVPNTADVDSLTLATYATLNTRTGIPSMSVVPSAVVAPTAPETVAEDTT